MASPTVYDMNSMETLLKECQNNGTKLVPLAVGFLNLKLLYVQGPTVSPVFRKRDGKVTADYYAIVICVPKKSLYKSVQQLRAVSHSSIVHCYRCTHNNCMNHNILSYQVLKISLDT